ncbi:MAG: hypothetical protein AAFP79_12325, partial [Pseudomonadota bacterium]
SQAVGAWAVAASIAFAVCTYQDSREDRNVDRSFIYLESFDGERLQNARRDIDEIILKADQAVLDFAKVYEAAAEEELTQEAKEEIFINSVLELSGTKAGDLPSALLDMTSFFGGFQTCIEEERCHGPTAHAFLDNYATSFWRQLGPTIVAMRARDRPTAGKKMQEFVKAAES